jgi:hypothetical protein
MNSRDDRKDYHGAFWELIAEEQPHELDDKNTTDSSGIACSSLPQIDPDPA